MVDIAPSVYNTNPLAGHGGFEKTLASFNGTRPLATELDEKQEIAQRVYEDEFKMSSNNPLSMHFTLDHVDVQKQARGEMYDAFWLGEERTNPELEINKDGYEPILRQPEPDNETVFKSKLEKGYNKTLFYQESMTKKKYQNTLKIKNHYEQEILNMV